MGWDLKYRPSKLDEVIGNEENIEALKKLVNQKNKPHSYLFYGDSGCGKTTVARIMAKEFGTDIEDIIEINCADKNGIETARMIIEQGSQEKLGGGNIVYILDEVQRTSAAWQNALLKVLEEPPKWLYFFLCTTNPEKLLKTVTNRCTQFKFSFPENNKVMKHLNNILQKEGKTLSRDVLKKIVKETSSIRECVKLIEKISDIEDEEKQLLAVKSVSSDEAETIELCRILLKRDWESTKKILKNITGEPESIRLAVLGYMTSVLMNGTNSAYDIMVCFEKNYYESGKAGLLMSCYEACN